jgi:Ca2+-binding EF-hand superfamily protein
VARLCEDVISGYGGPGGLDAEGVQGAIGLLRADARSDLMRRLWATDLDGDGAVMQGELEIAMRAMSAGQRARAIRLHELADVDGDDTVSPAEMRLAAEAAALARLGDDEAGLLRALMAFDADANGLVTRQEMRGGLAALHLDQGT